MTLTAATYAVHITENNNAHKDLYDAVIACTSGDLEIQEVRKEVRAGHEYIVVRALDMNAAEDGFGA